MGRWSELQREIRQLETQLDPASEATIAELSRVRRGLAATGAYEPAVTLPNLRIGFACKQRWDDMVGDDRVRACGGCNRPVFNLSAMTHDEAERVLATRGLTPCVRFYRRPDGTVMTTDCPTGAPREKRRLAVVAGSLAAGTALASPSASAEPAPEPTVETTDSIGDTPPPDPDATQSSEPVVLDPVKLSTERLVLDRDMDTMGIPVGHELLGVIIVEPRKRPKLEWSIWGRLGMGIATERPTVLARRLTPPEDESTSTWEAALAADVTVGIARDGNIRLGAWGELRTSSEPVAGGELVVAGLPPHPYDSRIGGGGSVVLRAGGNGRIITAAFGVGYVGSFPRVDPWIGWARHLVGARIVASMNRSLDDPRDWSATLGLEVEPLGAVRAVFDVVTGR